MIDFDRLLLGPAYATFARQATYTAKDGSTRTVSVIDNTDGALVGENDGIGTLLPVMTVRRTDLGTSSPEGGTVSLGGKTWKIMKADKVLNGGGEATGELRLVLQEVRNG